MATHTTSPLYANRDRLYIIVSSPMETIEDDAFRECYQLSTINLPNSLKYIGKGVFGDCDVLREPLFNDRYFAHFPKNHAATYSIPDGIQEVLDGAFLRYWWNKTTEEFTTLYDFRADVGDEWDIKVGNETITVHVDAIEESNVLDSLNYRVLMISDANDIFSGSVVCGVGHLTSFFPEILMTQGKNHRVEGLRCYWRYGFLTLK